MTVVPLLRAANALIEAYMAGHAPSPDGTQPAPPSEPEELRELNKSLAQIAARMDEMKKLRDTATEPELARYLGNLEGLRDSLTQAEQDLKARRDELCQRRDTLQKAMSWTQSYKELG